MISQKLVAVLSRHKDVGQYQVGCDLGQPPFRQVAVVHRDNLDASIGKREIDHLLNGDAVIGNRILVAILILPQQASARRARMLDVGFQLSNNLLNEFRGRPNQNFLWCDTYARLRPPRL